MARGRDPEKRKASQRAFYERNKERLKAKERAKWRVDVEHSRKRINERMVKRRATEEGKKERQEIRKRAAERKGKGYRTSKERSELKAARETEKARRSEEWAQHENKWIVRLKKELPDLHDPSLSISTLVYRARYNLDDIFKAREIARAAKSDSKATLLDDGSLTPEIMRLLFTRKDCPYCGRRMASQDKTLDHIIPRWRGGWHSKRNAIVCCYSCNSKKRAKTPEQWLECIDKSRQVHVRRAWQSAGAGEAAQGWLIVSNG